jgi:Rps23 Pro-64 3,4-dihydroxylase Tpa1-like proline 4-hydroxylase|tara:strand:- start:928 stop:1500 length:573 start_codon:yes stop_codon:yes gene_type:complete
MYLKANIDDCALIINDFLPNELFKKIKNYNYKHNYSSHDDWEKGLYLDKDNFKTMRNINVQEKIAVFENEKIKGDEIFQQFFRILLNCPYIPFQTNSKITLSYYEYEKFSGINWHDDGKYTLNYSFYIHESWDNNWGGETLIDTERGLPLASYPYPNTLLAIKNNIQHKVCPVTGPIKRKVLQIRGIFYE